MASIKKRIPSLRTLDADRLLRSPHVFWEPRITDGSASVLGIDVSTKDKEVREKIGVALQDTGIDNLLTGRELFFTTCRLWGYSKKDSEKRTTELLELVGLVEAADRRVKTYSGGMKRRLDLGLRDRKSVV